MNIRWASGVSSADMKRIAINCNVARFIWLIWYLLRIWIDLRLFRHYNGNRLNTLKIIYLCKLKLSPENSEQNSYLLCFFSPHTFVFHLSQGRSINNHLSKSNDKWLAENFKKHENKWKGFSTYVLHRDQLDSMKTKNAHRMTDVYRPT